MNEDELDRKERIKTEYDRIIGFYQNMNENAKAVILPLIQNAAFMKITLEDLQDLIQRDGVVDYYQNGANQSGLKQSAALQSYNSLIKNYSAIIKSLCEYLPPQARASVSVSMQTVKEPQEDRRRREEERSRQIEEEIRLAVAYQEWQRAQEAKGEKPAISFTKWKEDQRREGVSA